MELKRLPIHTMALLLALVRKLHIVAARAKDGDWDWRAVGSVLRLRGMRLGLVGFVASAVPWPAALKLLVCTSAFTIRMCRAALTRSTP
jgi:hypothetical protein